MTGLFLPSILNIVIITRGTLPSSQNVRQSSESLHNHCTVTEDTNQLCQHGVYLLTKSETLRFISASLLLVGH